jgi:hypothetical protein
MIMTLNRKDFEQEAQQLLADKTWKGHVILGVIILIVAAVVSSPVFVLVRALLEIVLTLGGLGLVGWGIYQYMQAKEIK